DPPYASLGLYASSHFKLTFSFSQRPSRGKGHYRRIERPGLRSVCTPSPVLSCRHRHRVCAAHRSALEPSLTRINRLLMIVTVLLLMTEGCTGYHHPSILNETDLQAV